MRSISEYDLDAAAWYKSSYSGGSGDNCLEVTHDHLPALIPVRDSKNPRGPKLTFGREAWSAFVRAI
ncbi:DUF397 domain-containing protein [Streptomyces resistomycificus]|uniref:DUF397 domain-containing protein n=1 Tax=Streptomyces resistomycificus TaxID=67356 RepID=A0A0L8L6Z3_9ACTN|nr:DUF397 domain-containing protein [Streptomyces resistomycificus]KOG33978.1 hypothetical protein ADK37_20760 [Streptomyces resistomycificus]KUN96482.1 hypothetical protein AQJ84_19070 [Streptomyces resistomycificus]